jgi:hypothetical protein
MQAFFKIRCDKIHVWDLSTPLAYKKSKASGTTELSDILRLVEIIPIDNGRLKKSINAKISLKDHDNIVNEKTLRVLFGQDDDPDSDGKKKIQSASETLFDF